MCVWGGGRVQTVKGREEIEEMRGSIHRVQYVVLGRKLAKKR